MRNVAMYESRIHVSFIPIGIDDALLTEIFSRIAPVQICYINKKKVADGPRIPFNFGFVTFKDNTTAAKLVNQGYVKIPSKIARNLVIPDFRQAF